MKQYRLESEFQRDLIQELKDLFPGCVVLKNDSQYMQGIPDLTILYRKRWAMLEVKVDYFARHQPNQDYYINKLGDMSYAAFIYPDNKEVILAELQQALSPRR